MRGNHVSALLVCNSEINQTVVVKSGDGAATLALSKPMDIPDPITKMVDRIRESRSMLGAALAFSGCRTVLLTGMSGIGKTTLVRSWARRFGVLYPDGQFYIDLKRVREGGGAAVADELRAQMARVVGLDRLNGLSPDDIRALFLRFTHKKRILVIVEDVQSEEELELFTPNSPRSLVLATSSLPRSGIDAHNARLGRAMKTLRVGSLSDRHARRLFRASYDNYRNLAEEVVTPEKKLVDEVIRYSQGVPVVLDACARLAADNCEALFAAGELGSVDLGGDNPFVELWEGMVEAIPSDEAKKQFYLLGLLPTTNCPEVLLRFLWGCESKDTAIRAMRELWKFNLASKSSQKPSHAFEMCSDLHRYAKRESRLRLTAADRDEAYSRLVTFYRQFAQCIDFGMSEDRLRLGDFVASDDEIASYVSEIGVMTAFDSERDRMSMVLKDALGRPSVKGAIWPIGDALWPAFHEGGYHQAGLELFELCLEDARADDRPDACARFLALCSRCCADMGNHAESARYIREAEETCAYDNPLLAASITEFRGASLSKAGNSDGAIAAYEDARLQFGRIGRSRGIMLADYLIGKELLAKGDAQAAVRRFLQASNLVDERNDVPSAIKVYRQLSEAHFLCGDYREAVRCSEYAMELCVSEGYWLHRVHAATLLIRCRHMLGDDKAALVVACDILASSARPEDMPELEGIINSFDSWGLANRLRRSLNRIRRKNRRMRFFDRIAKWWRRS